MEEIRPNNPKDQLIYDLCRKNITLSYSTLKNFTSPINLINYKLKPYKKSPSMIFGSLCDVLLLTPENFESEFKIIDKVPESDNQVAFSNGLIDLLSQLDGDLTEEMIEIEFKKHYKRGDALKTFEVVKDYVYGKHLGLEIISQSMYEEALEICENLKSNKDIEIIFSQITDVQKKVTWIDYGWNFKGFLDILLPDHIIDLKFSKDANPEKFERDIMNFDYFLQAAMYIHALKESGISKDPKYSFIVYDKSFNYSIIELDYTFITYGFRKYQYLLQELDRCIAESCFDESYGFFKRSYKAYKPKWAKGFKLNGEEDGF